MPPIDCSIAQNASAARVVAPYAHTLWEAALTAGADLSQLQSALGRDAIGNEDVPVEQYLSVLQIGHQQGGPLFGWQLGQHVKPTTYGVNGILLLACPTLRDALEQVLRFESLVHDLGRSQFVSNGTHATYTWRNDWSQHAMAGALTESVFAGIQTCAQWLTGQTLTDVSIVFAHHADKITAQTIAEASLAEVIWGGKDNHITFPAQLLDCTIPQANTSLLPLLQEHAAQLLQARHPQDAGIAQQVRQCITQRIGNGPVKLSDVAQDLLLSTRTLQRRLSEAGVPFQTLLDHTRHELAQHYLRNSAMPIAEVGFLLGFADTPAFHHAFKNWQGQGPGQYRTSQRDSGFLLPGRVP
jgi:AraC-like DNA-binding protein